MVKQKTVYICQSCSSESPQWLGQCTDCKEWNTYVEEIKVVSVSVSSKLSSRVNIGGIKPILLSSVKKTTTKRVSSGSEEFDRVLGGGLVPGQVILLAGDPGVGKSTLLTQVSKNFGDRKVLYICGEENVSQVRVRADRMGYKADNLYVVSETDSDVIGAIIEQTPGLSLVIIDSIQTLTSVEFTGFAGSVGQVRGSTQKLTAVAKRLSLPVILVGHVTKSGTVAGPKVLEHIVDTVLVLEGDSQHLYRILKTTKNRFGPISEVGIFEMVEEGMREVKNPSEMFLGERLKKAPGSCVTAVMEGHRPLLFEIQALTTKTSFGYPMRTASGFNVNRLKVLIAILEKRCGLNLYDQDVYVNVAGGFKVNEYATDLAVCVAIASSLKDKPVGAKTVVFGEAGLSGEVRRVSNEKKRAKEARNLGYTNVIGPSKYKSVKDVLREVF